MATNELDAARVAWNEAQNESVGDPCEWVRNDIARRMVAAQDAELERLRGACGDPASVVTKALAHEGAAMEQLHAALTLLDECMMRAAIQRKTVGGYTFDRTSGALTVTRVEAAGEDAMTWEG